MTEEACDQRNQTDIMVVEDHSEMRALVQTVLEERGYAVVSAENGQDGLRLLKSGCSPKVVLVDFEMPGMDGLTFAREVRAMPNLSSTALVLMSAAQEVNLRAPSELFQQILPKPLRTAGLIDLARRFCGPRSRLEPINQERVGSV